MLAVAGCLTAAVIAGCGPSERAPDAASVAERFYTALEERDGGAACSELKEETSDKLEQEEERPCEEAVVSLELPRGGSAAGTNVYLTTASVDLAEGGTTFLDEGPDGWKVSAAGCRPTAADLPYDCELED
jgi:hypothetical protein